MTLRAHFDGKVIVPDEPVDLPVNSAFEIEIKQPIGRRNKKSKMRNGICLARNDGVKMTSAEGAAILDEE